MPDNDTRETARDYLNGYIKESELVNMFDLSVCGECKKYELTEDMTYHRWDIGESQVKICPSCREDE